MIKIRNKKSKLLMTFLAYTDIWVNEYSTTIHHGDINDNDFLDLLYQKNLDNNNLIESLNNYWNQKEDQLAGHVISLNSKDKREKEALDYFTSVTAFDPLWLCDYEIDYPKYLKYVNTDKGISDQYFKETESFLQKIVNNLDQHDLRVMQHTVLNHGKKFIRQIYNLDSILNIVFKHATRFKWHMFFKQTNSFFHGLKYIPTKREQQIDNMLSEYEA